MYILTNNKNEIIAISEICERIEEYRNIKLDDHNIAYAPDEIINVYEVDTVDEGMCEQKYCYTEADGFYVNESYVEPVDEKAEMEQLKEQVTELQLAMVELAGSEV